MASSKRKAPAVNDISSFNTFKVVKPKGKTRGRSKYDPQNREKVKGVRERRACLRCSLLKIPCSNDDLCTSCEKLAFVVHAHETRTLSFSGCIRTRLTKVSVFESVIPPEHIMESVIAKSGNLAFKSITLNFATQVTWDLDDLVSDFVNWFNNSQSQISTTSKVGTLASPNFMQLIESLFEFEDRMSFQRMLYAESLAYVKSNTSSNDHLSVPELHQVGALAGHSFLKFLEEKLKPQL